MFSKETYDELCSAIIKKGVPSDFIEDYESIVGNLNEMLNINRKEVLDDNALSELDLSYLFSLRWGVATLAVSSGFEGNFTLEAFRGLFLSIANTIFAIIKLAQDGFDYQATILIRNLYELCFTMLAIIIEPIKREAFVEGSRDEKAYETWRKHFTFNNLDKTIREYEEKIKNSIELDEFLIVWRKNNYKSFSNYVHNDFTSLYLYGHKLSNDENLQMNLWGEQATRIDIILGNMNSVLWYTELLFRKLMVDKAIDINNEYFVVNEEGHDFWNFASFTGFLAEECFFKLFENKAEN